ncbi:MAG: hypothetical protein U0L18_08235 [Acutalibacteraceae bacterium]|nr:hypothetical protein [Acutalibacteraceae bacterium]
MSWSVHSAKSSLFIYISKKLGLKALDHIFDLIPNYYKRAIIADMAFGEEAESGFFVPYYAPNHSLVKNQELIHGVR